MDAKRQGQQSPPGVVFRDGAERAKQVLPFSEFDSADPEDLWKYMAAYEEKTGGRVLAIPHNSNLSGGMMFASKTWTGKPFDKKYAETRARFERLVEASQTKGDSETTPLLSPTDEFANFERWDKANLFGTDRDHAGDAPVQLLSAPRSSWAWSIRRSSASTRSSSA